MNEVAMEIIQRLGDEVAILRGDVRELRKVLTEKDKEFSSLKENADMYERSTDYWFKEWQKLRKRCIDGGIMDESEVREDGLPF